MNSAGIYIHIPFCKSRCSYCDFATGAYNAELAARYVAALAREIESFSLPAHTSENFGDVSRISVDTIYFGGGTPSLLTPLQVEAILNAIHEKFDVDAGAELTLEINPGTLTKEKAEALRTLGINRASFGAQTFDDAELARLGRAHTSADVRATFQILRDAGFTNISFDLIAGLPEQTLAGWSRNLDEAFKLRPEHLSLYLLEIHEATPLAAQLRQGRYAPPDEDVAAEMYELLIARTRAEGYEHYEISNFCLSGYESRHNSKYWTCQPVYGFGCAAHSHDGAQTRWSNERDARRYVELIEAGRSATVETATLEPNEQGSENLFLHLRLLQGVDLLAHERRFGKDVRSEFAVDLERLRDAGLVELNGERLRLTSRGALLSNEVFAVFV